jgi:hypothetical protein
MVSQSISERISKAITSVFLSFVLAVCAWGQTEAPAQKGSPAYTGKGQPCATVIPLGQKGSDNKKGFERLDLHKRIYLLVNTAGFSDQQLKAMPPSDIAEEAFSAYAFGYVTWQEPLKEARDDFLRVFRKAHEAVEKYPGHLSADEKAFLHVLVLKLQGVMTKSFDLGRTDASHSPCPF